MGFLKRAKQIIKGFDMFAQVPSYRYNEEAQYQTSTGGCISIMLIFTFIGIFSTTLLNTIDRKQVYFTQSRKAQQSPAYYVTTLQRTFLFAVGMENLDMNSGERYFDVKMEFRKYDSTNRTKTSIPLVSCEKGPWESRGYGDKYQRVGLTKWLCPKEGTQLQLEGKYTSDLFKFYKISVTKCSNSTDPSRPCANSSTIQNYLNANEVFNFNFYYINTIINPGDSDQEYLKDYLEDVNYLSFTPTDGISANLFISSYNIDTDQSLWPVTSTKEDAGGIVLEKAEVHNYPVRGTEYLKFYLRKSPITLQIARSFRKVDDTLSYIGGLFSFILVFLWFVGNYNELSFDVQLTRNSYYTNDNEPFDANFFNFLTYFPYLIYKFLDKFKVNLDWDKYKKLHNFIEEGRRHLDIRLITRKILLIQKIGLTVLGQKQFQALMLSEPLTLDKAEQVRQSLKFHKRFVKQFPKKSTVQQNDRMLSSSSSIPSGKSIMNTYSNPQIVSSEVIQQNQNPRHFEDLGRVRIRSIKHKQEFDRQLLMVKKTMDELQQLVARDDQVAKRIWRDIDEKIKDRYLMVSRREMFLR